jgi:hypothetical protein
MKYKAVISQNLCVIDPCQIAEIFVFGVELVSSIPLHNASF